ncbi:hypothetical protein BC830DRAFT_1104640 [Chytriomyces sp. MP71]|nr:hypothetical protein BC830DRAFT_1104640 [Chytriomyces sp. MP71]
MGSWMRSHDTFRRHAKGILDGIRTLDQTTFLTALGKSPKVLREQFEKWHNNMGSHERYEESRLYPFAARRWDVDTRYLTSEHGTMHSQRDLVLGLFAQLLNFEGTPAQYGTPALACAVAKLEATMADYELYVCVHLAEEEEFIVPMFLELTVEEYKDYEDLGLTELFRKMDQQDKANGVKTKGKRR